MTQLIRDFDEKLIAQLNDSYLKKTSMNQSDGMNLIFSFKKLNKYYLKKTKSFTQRSEYIP